MAGKKLLMEIGTKIVAVGRNYAAHARELGNAPPKVRSRPLLFSAADRYTLYRSYYADGLYIPTIYVASPSH
jgi:2-keto-4-pentenoate hydratase/2-oxohepta-3-ene-1,7-dioic acid hydratase in catechol pathway